MTKDRLLALKEKAQQHGHDEDEEAGGEGDALNKECPVFMQEFFAQVEQIHKSVDVIAVKVADVKKKHGEILFAPQADEKMKGQLDELMSDIKNVADNVRQQLRDIESKIKEDEQCDMSCAALRIRKSQHATLSRKFREVMDEYNMCQVLYREGCKNRIKRQLESTGRAMTNDEIEEMLEAGDPSVFTQGILIDTVQAKQSLRDIQARHNDIMQLENSIRELHDMFMDIADLVQQQGEMIDQIEYNVTQAEDYVASGKEQTGAAVVLRKKVRRKKLYIILCVVIVVVVLTIIIALAVALG